MDSKPPTWYQRVPVVPLAIIGLVAATLVVGLAHATGGTAPPMRNVADVPTMTATASATPTPPLVALSTATATVASAPTATMAPVPTAAPTATPVPLELAVRPATLAFVCDDRHGLPITITNISTDTGGIGWNTAVTNGFTTGPANALVSGNSTLYPGASTTTTPGGGGKVGDTFTVTVFQEDENGQLGAAAGTVSVTCT